MFTPSPPFPSFPVLLSLLSPSNYSVKPYYKQFQIQKLHVHLSDVNKKNYYKSRAYIVHVVMTYGHFELHQSVSLDFYIITRLWPVLRRDNFSVYVICASRIIFNNLTYMKSTSGIWITQAIQRAKAYL